MTQHTMPPESMQTAMKDMFAAAEAWQRNAQLFWENQDGMLDKMQALADAWFERRHAGTHAAMQTCDAMCRAKTPAEWLAAYQQWLGGVWEGTLADGMACQRELQTAADAIAPSLMPSRAETRHDATKKERAAA